MNLYNIYNGYQGDGPVHVIVIAESEQQAKELASEAFKKNALREKVVSPFDTPFIKEQYYIYPENYWTDLEVDLLYHINDESFVSEIFD